MSTGILGFVKGLSFSALSLFRLYFYFACRIAAKVYIRLIPTVKRDNHFVSITHFLLITFTMLIVRLELESQYSKGLV